MKTPERLWMPIREKDACTVRPGDNGLANWLDCEPSGV